MENISAVIKKYTMTNLSDSDIHLQYIGTYDGVEGDSASITMATVIISALENIPIRQDLAMTGSLSVRGKVLPVGGVTAKLEAAAASGIKMALIPADNAKDVMIENRYYKTMEIYTVETLRDVFEYAFVDCPMKQQYLDKLLPLNKDGVSSAKKLEPPVEYHYHIQEEPPEMPPQPPAAEPVPEVPTVSEPEHIENPSAVPAPH